jgi:uncharacterized delta-60 repeat protein
MRTSWLAMLLLVANAVGAADGDLDPSFGTGGKVVTTLADHAGAADVAIQDDGKIVVVATLQSNDPLIAPAMAVVRYLPTGALDTSFAGVGWVAAQVDTFGGGGRAVAIQPDGHILALGQTQAVTHGASIMFLMRYDADGIPDASFGVGGMVQFPALVVIAGDVAPTTGDTILVTELDASASFATETRVRRLLADGTPDSSFGTAGSVAVPLTNFSLAPEMAFRADGTIVLGSAQIVAVTPAIVSAFAAARLLPAGAMDTSFGTGGVSPAFGDTHYVQGGGANGIALQSDERLVLAGATSGHFALVGMGADGGTDASFGTGGVFSDAFAPSANAIAAVGGNRFVAAGGGGAEFALARVTASAALDPSFGTGGKVLTSFGDSFASANGLAVQDDGALVAVGTTGSASGSRIALARYLVVPPCADTDGDGLCDAADECPDGALFSSARLDATDSSGTACDDRLLLTGAVDVPLTPAIDPAATGLRAVVRNGMGEALLDDTLPAGPYAGGTRTGWRVRTSPGGTTWRFSRPADAGAVSRAVVRRRTNAPGVLKIRVKGAAICFAAPVSSLPLSATVVLRPDGQCGEARFPGAPQPACASRSGGSRIVCR